MCIISESHVMYYSGRRFQAKVTRPRGSPAEPPPHLLVCLSALRSQHKPATVSVVPVVSISAIWKIWHSGWSVSSGRLYVVAKAKALSPCLISVFLCAAKRPPLCFDWSPPLVWGNLWVFLMAARRPLRHSSWLKGMDWLSSPSHVKFEISQSFTSWQKIMKILKNLGAGWAGQLFRQGTFV